MSVFRCPECGHEESFRGYHSVLLDMNGDGELTTDSVDVSDAEFDKSYIMICGKCDHADTAASFYQ
jgi:DNA-directed RNA polymerase subunit M/transcription elongation factor TFIIS